ncbi:hypothetical protein QAD02_019099 [Eretmocerus hayati]|uniref:Uncharacterized protein n=1 Tax=Eretmocerus hayati TaxID=131215 RepID=A0ACC2PLQ7_9HYME|nr:hypothetical protein QAD02_019099 [Eretmocerus hayati]
MTSVIINKDVEILLSDKIIGPDIHVFAACSNRTQIAAVNCDVFTKKSSDDTEANFTKVCNFSRNLNNGSAYIEEIPLELDLLESSGHAIVTWVEKNSKAGITYRKLVLLDMSSCNSKYLKIMTRGIHPSDSISSNIVTYPDKFDVFSSGQRACGYLSICRVSYNKKRMKLGQPMPFEIDLKTVRIVPVSPLSSNKGFFVYSDPKYGGNASILSIYTVDSCGENFKLLADIHGNVEKNQLATSNSHELFTICSKKLKLNDEYDKEDGILDGDGEEEDTIIHCTQFDSISGGARIEITGNYDGSKGFAVYNTKGGGFLLLTVYCDVSSNPVCKTYDVDKVDVEGRLTNIKVGILNFGCSGDLHKLKIILQENENEYCFHFSCVSELRVHLERLSSTVYFQKHCILKFGGSSEPSNVPTIGYNRK